MKKIFSDLMLWLEIKLYLLKEYLSTRKYKKLCPDYENNEYNCGSLKHIWGIKSWDDLTGKDACLYTMNDIDITYDREKNEYLLGVETALIFDTKEDECKYLKRLLEAFTKFMDDNGYSKEYSDTLFCRGVGNEQSAKSIEELYFNFRVFVEGYCVVHGFK